MPQPINPNLQTAIEAARGKVRTPMSPDWPQMRETPPTPQYPSPWAPENAPSFGPSGMRNNPRGLQALGSNILTGLTDNPVTHFVQDTVGPMANTLYDYELGAPNNFSGQGLTPSQSFHRKAAVGDYEQLNPYSRENQEAQKIADNSIPRNIDRQREDFLVGALFPGKIEPGVMDQALNFRRANMISSPVLPLRIGVGDLVHGAATELSRAPAAAADWAMSKTFKTPRTTAGMRLENTPVLDAFTTPKRVLSRIWNSTLKQTGIGKSLFTDVAPENKTLIDKYANKIYEIHDKAYQPFKEAAYERSLAEQSKVKAINEYNDMVTDGKAPAEGRIKWIGNRYKDIYNEYIREWRKGGSENQPVTDEATQEALRATFLNENHFANWLQDMRANAEKHFGGVGKVGFDLAVPYTKVPSNVIGSKLEYITGIPEAILTPIIRAWKGKQGLLEAEEVMPPAIQKTLARRFGRGSLGAVLGVIGWNLGPTISAINAPVDVNAPSAEEFDPGSITIQLGPGVRVPMEYLGPEASVIGMFARLRNASDNGENIGDMLQDKTLAKDLSFAAYGNAPGTFDLSAFQTGNLKSPLVSLGNSFVPFSGFIGDAAKYTDTDTLSGELYRAPNNWIDSVKAHYPGLREQLDLKDSKKSKGGNSNGNSFGL